MSGTEVAGLIESIDASIADNKNRVEAEVTEFIRENAEMIAEEIATKGFVTIPTSAGDYKITEQDLESAVA
jgi:hypothetical protein